MAKVKFLDQHGLQTVVAKIKRLTTGVYTVKGRAIYADDAYLANPDKEQDIDSNGVWQYINGAWTKITQFSEGEVYDIINAFTTDSDFAEGAGKTVPAETNIVVINVGTAQLPVIKFDVFSGILNLEQYQTKALVDALTVFTNETPAVYVSSITLPTSEAKASATITNGMIAVIGGTSSETGDVYKATVTTNLSDVTMNDIAWTKLGNQLTVEGSLALLGAVSPNTPITDAEIEAMFL